jgi:hypothetical protein
MYDFIRGTALGAAFFSFVITSSMVRAAVRTWDGGAATNLASEAVNWSDDTAPVAGDHIVLDPATNRDLAWDLDVAVASWTQTGYTGTVSFATVFPGKGAFTNFLIAGNCVLSNGTWTHRINSGVTVEVERLAVTIQGDLTLGADAWIKVDGRGFASLRGPGAGGNGIYSQGATHGGIGGKIGSRATYGSIVAPTNHGSGAGGAGGGTVRLHVGGHARIDGTIRSSGVTGVGNAANTASAGGSIWITAASMSGAGSIDASGFKGLKGGGGGGGRIAVILAAGTDFGNVQFIAPGGASDSLVDGAGAGTVYLETMNQPGGRGTLRVVNAGIAPLPQYASYTLMPLAGPYTPDPVDLDAFGEIVIGGMGVLAVNSDTALTNLSPGRFTTTSYTNAFLALQSTNQVVFPDRLIVSNYSLFIDVPARLPGDVRVVTNGNLAHSLNNTVQAYKLDLTIAGNLTVEPGGQINVNESGFAGPYHNPIRYNSASYGGRGKWVTTVSNVSLTYGSVRAPADLGSHAVYLGGGAALLNVAGTTTLHGVISARGQRGEGNESPGSGGSVYLRTGHLAGNGVIDVQGGWSRTCGGGGGRISVVLTASDSFGDVGMNAGGGEDRFSSRVYGAAGTIYRETPSQGSGFGDLIVTSYAHSYTSYWDTVYTELPAATNYPAGELDHVTLQALTNCTIGLSTNLTLQDIYLMRDDTILYLNGFDLTLKVPYHADWGTSNRVVHAGGRIVWKDQPKGAVLWLR